MGTHEPAPRHAPAFNRQGRKRGQRKNTQQKTTQGKITQRQAAASHPLLLRIRVWVWRLRFVILAVCVAGFVQQSAAILAPHSATHQVVVAAREIPAGSVLKLADLTVAAVPLSMPGSSDLDEFIGHTMVVALETGFPIHSSLIAGEQLWRNAPPGTTVVAVELADSSLVPLLQVGENIDLYSSGGSNWDTSQAQKVATHALILAIIEPKQATGGIISTDPVNDTYSLLLAISAKDATLVTGASSQIFRAAISPSANRKN